MSSALRLHVKRAGSELPMADRGRVLNAQEIADAVFGGKVSKKWVFQNVPESYRYKIGRLILFYENEVREWMDTKRGAA